MSAQPRLPRVTRIPQAQVFHADCGGSCGGSGDPHLVFYAPTLNAWHCDCPSGRHVACRHIRAAQAQVYRAQMRVVAG